jgi:hypothetical protein
MSSQKKQPTLIATSNPHREPRPLTSESNKERAACPDMKHPIVAQWGETVMPAIIAIIDELKLPMNHMDMFKLYRPFDPKRVQEEEEEAPHVIFIGVSRDKVSEELATEVVTKCDAVLKEQGFTDVFVEVHESRIVLY